MGPEQQNKNDRTPNNNFRLNAAICIFALNAYNFNKNRYFWASKVRVYRN